jgi:hypothetical protein
VKAPLKDTFELPNPMLRPTVPKAEVISNSTGKGDIIHGFLSSKSMTRIQQKVMPATTLINNSVVYCFTDLVWLLRVALMAIAFGLELQMEKGRNE